MAATLALAAAVLTVLGGAVHLGAVRAAVEFRTGDTLAVPASAATDAAWGFALALCYGLGMLLGTAAAGWVWRSRPGRAVVRYAVTATLLAVVAHTVENVLLLTVAGSASAPVWVLEAVTATAVLKYAALLPAGAIALGGAAVLVWRCVAHSPDELTRRAEHVLDTVPPRPIAPDDPAAPYATRERAPRGLDPVAGTEVPATAVTGTDASIVGTSTVGTSAADLAAGTDGVGSGGIGSGGIGSGGIGSGGADLSDAEGADTAVDTAAGTAAGERTTTGTTTPPCASPEPTGERLIDERITPGERSDTARATRWRNAYVVPGVRPDAIAQRWERGEDTTGVCLSGGGIRAASVALGALQSLRAELLSARYLVSVSGGGYTAGAFQQALTGAGTPPPNGTVLRDSEAAFGEGTAELNHVRRHSSYLADTPGEVLGALGRLARGLLLSLAVLFGPAVVGGVAVGWFYEHLPVTALPLDGDGMPAPRTGALVALGVVAATAYVLAVTARGEPARRTTTARAARQLVALAWVIAAVVLVIPTLVGATSWLLFRTDRTFDVGGPLGAVLLTYLSALAAMAWRHRVPVGRVASGLLRRRGAGALTAVLPDGLTQRLLVIGTTGLLVLLWLLLFGAAATTRGTPTALAGAAAVLAVVVVLGGVFDVTSLSLHPFYRERLARAFAVRAVRRHDDGQVVAVPYDPAEHTTLSAYGTTAEGVPFPEVIFAAAANLTGEHRTPPGLGAVSYTMSARWTGGPDVGWVRTDDLERIAPDRIRHDLTVQGAVAFSGAAFASAMGRASRWYQVLLAVSGARLGSWLPNPAFLRRAHEAARAGDWAYPWLPRARRLSYLVREVVGSHPHHDRLVHVSDGGHYDNLGLVELLRRRCTLIYCVDASNDTPPTARTLAEALELAWQELGVRVVLDDPWRADPGSGESDAPDSPLAPRLAHTPIITGTVYYPPESGLPGHVTGRLVVGRAVLWPDLPYSLQSYAAHHPEFPYDSTGDQWFDHGQFSAYTELGRHVGAEARRVLRHHTSTPANNHP